jgi:hypothetical protein
MLALTSLISGCRLVRSRTQATEFCFVCDRSGEYECGGCSKAITLCLARYFLTTCGQCVNSSNACSNLWEEYCECFHWYLLNALSSVILHNTSTCLMFCHLLKLTVTSSADRYWHSQSHHENIYATHKRVFPSLLPYHMLLHAFMSLKEICVAKHKMLYSHIVL